MNPATILFELINHNELDLNKIKTFSMTYNSINTLRVLIKQIIQKYKQTYFSQYNISANDITLLYKGDILDKSLHINQFYINSMEPIIMLINIAKTKISAASILNSFLAFDFATSLLSNTIPEITPDVAESNTQVQANTNLITDIDRSDSTEHTESADENMRQQNNLDKLTNMGFTESLSKTALSLTDTLEEAIDLLVGS